MSDATTTINACAGLVARIVPHCAPTIAAPPSPNTDALAASLAAQGNAISAQANYLTLATIVLGIVAVLATLGWGWLVKIWAEKAANDAVEDWLNKNAPDMISKLVANIIPSGSGTSMLPPMSQEEQEKGLGEDPTNIAG